MKDFEFKHTTSLHKIIIKAENSVQAVRVMQRITPKYKEWELSKKQ